MTTDVHPIAVEQRLAQLERRYARLSRITVGACVAALLAGTVAFGLSVVPRLEANHLVLRDSSSRTSVDLSLDDQGRLELRFNGTRISGGPASAQLRLVDETGRVVAQLGSQLVHQAEQ